MTQEQQRTRLENTFPLNTFRGETKRQLVEFMLGEIRAAESRMGDAVIERMHQANYQWEKAESLIQGYELQKEKNIHNLKALKANKPSEGK